MNEAIPRKLPPLSAVEFAIEQTFRNIGLSLLLVLVWGIVLVPLALADYAMGLADGTKNPAAMKPGVMAMVAVFVVVVLMAALSISVNWYRRVLNDETPRRLQWLRLDGPVWRMLGAVILLVVFIGVIGAAGFLAMTKLPPLLIPLLGGAGQGLATGVSVILGLIGLIGGCRLVSKLPAAATGDRDYAALRTSKRNFWRFLGMLFWLLFTLAVAGAIAAGGYFLQMQVNNPWTVGLAVFLGVVTAWFALFFLLTIPASLYRYFGEGKDFGPG